MDENIDVTTRESESAGDVLARSLLEESKGHHRTLNAAQFRYTAPEAQQILGALHQLRCERRRSGVLVNPVERLMGFGAPMQATIIPCRVSYARLRREKHMLG